MIYQEIYADGVLTYEIEIGSWNKPYEEKDLMEE